MESQEPVCFTLFFDSRPWVFCPVLSLVPHTADAVALPLPLTCTDPLSYYSPSKLSLSTPNSSHGERNPSISKRFGGESSSHGGRNPFNSVTTPGPGLASPGGANFGLGTVGAFSSFGSTKTPKSPGNTLDAVKVVGDGAAKDVSTNGNGNGNGTTSKAEKDTRSVTAPKSAKDAGRPSETLLQTPWCFWFRPSIPKNVSIPYDETVHGLAEVATAEQFWAVYRHLARPSTLHPVSDYHLFKKGVRPIWEDEENRNGGKWLVRLKKGVADRYWEDLMLALIGDQFHDAGVEICGAVVSIRNGEDIISIWTASKEGKMIRIR